MRADAPVANRPARARRAWVTLVTNPDYALGARALVNSLRQSRTAADIVVLHTPAVEAADLEPLADLDVRLAACALLPTSEEFNKAHGRARLHDAAPFTRGEKPAFHTPLDNFVKLRLWQLDYAEAVFVDADALVLRNCDRLFDYPEFSAAPNVYAALSDFGRMNSGVFVARPSAATYARMLRALDQPGAFWPRTDQTFLQGFFPDWHGLPVYCNLLQYVWLNLPELWDWDQVRILHYQYEKPWDPANAKRARLGPLVDLWQAYFEGHGIPSDLSALPRPPAAPPLPEESGGSA